MKKTFSIFIAVAMIFGAVGLASAATSVSVTLTSPTITEATGACEKAGAVTFAFPAGSILTAGDWWYMDLPSGATLCKPIDYLIVSDGVDEAANTYVGVSSTDPTTVYFKNAAAGITTLSYGTGAGKTDAGPISIEFNGAVPGFGVVPSAGSKFAFHVVGVQGSRRVTIYLAGDAATVAAAGTLTVQPDNTMKIKILDGGQYNTTNADASDTRIITDINKTMFSTTDATTKSTTGIYAMFGQHTGDALTPPDHIEVVGSFPAANKVPFVENTLCVSAPGVGNLFVSFASKNDKFTFTGDSQIAHTGSAASFTLSTCVGKTASTDTIKISEQSSCQFDYETAGTGGAVNNYCPTHAAGMIYLTSSSTFGELDDLFDIQFQSMTTGVYFSGTAAIKGWTSAQDQCQVAGAAVATTNDYCSGTSCFNSGATTLAYPDNSCTITDLKKIDIVKTTGGTIANVFNYKTLGFNFSNFVYDNSVVTSGTEVTLKVILSKYPCGTIFSDTVTIGSFVSSCTQAVATTTNLLFPYLPGTKYAGWWSGYVITNGSTTAGTAALTLIDENGNMATYTTPSIAGGKFFNASYLQVSDLTQGAGNTANVDFTENYVVKVVCNFDKGAGFAFLGNTDDGQYATGYVAESSAW